MILIDNNINLNRNLFYFFKLNNNLKKYKYIFFCYNFNAQSLILRNLNKIDYYFIKKLKRINYLSIIYPYLLNSINMYCTNDINIIYSIISELKNHIIFCKIDNNFYSFNSIQYYINSKTDLINYINIYYYNFISIFFQFKNIKN